MREHPSRERGESRAAAALVRRIGSAIVVASSLAALSARAELHAIWALDDGTKIGRDELQHRLRLGNGAFELRPPTVRLFGARNETVAFQLILTGGIEATSGVSVILSAVGAIRNADDLSEEPSRYWIGRRIELFRQHYLRIERRSAALTWEPGSAAEPVLVSEWVPDPLLPLRRGEAFVVPARQNQGLWFDITIPQGTAPGVHRGTLEVRVDGRVCTLAECKIDVELQVLPWSLPEVPTIKTMLFFSGSDNDRDGMPARYVARPWQAPQARIDALRAQHFLLGRRHRVTLFLGHDAEPHAALADRLSGRAFSREAGYEGPGEGVGQDVYSIHTFGGTLSPTQAASWQRWLKGQPNTPRYFLYVEDEPSSARFAAINQAARRARPIPAFVTSSYQPGLEVDIYAALADHYSPKTAARARASGREMWIYNGVRPFTGSFVTDDVAISPRVNPWIQFKYGIPRWFYWEATYYKDAQGGRGQIDVWREALNFTNGSDELNGDGLLIYPGRDVLFPRSDQHFDGPVPSIRLKNWRRGIQDVEYLVQAQRSKAAGTAQRILETLIPRALGDETEAGAPVSWPEDGENWLRARRLLADASLGETLPGKVTRGLGAPQEQARDKALRKGRALLQRLWSARIVKATGLLGLVLGLLTSIWIMRRRRRPRRS